MMGWIGTIELAAHGIALEVVALTFMVHLGLSTAATVRVGRAVGEGDAQGLRDGALTAIVMSVAFGLIAVAVLVSIPEPIIGLFLDEAKPRAPEIIVFGTSLLLMGALFQMFDAMQVMALGFLRGVQDTAAPMWLAAISYWVIGIPVSYALAFPLGFGGQGLWLGLVVGLAVASVLLMTAVLARSGAGACPGGERVDYAAPPPAFASRSAFLRTSTERRSCIASSSVSVTSTSCASVALDCTHCAVRFR